MTWDRGLQFERTDLAWRRTVLAVTAGLALAGRYLAAGNAVLGIALPTVALVCGVGMLWLFTARIRQAERVVRAITIGAPTIERMPGGGLITAVALMTGLSILAGVIFVSTSALT